MNLVLDEEQSLLQQTARQFVSESSSLRRIRALRDGRDPLGYSPDLWRQMGRLGWLGIPFPLECGGAGLGSTELMVVLEELGRGLMPEPVVSSVLLGGMAVLLAGSAAQRQAFLAPMIAGELRLALAYEEPRSRYNLTHVETRATPNGTGWRLQGEKVHVLDGFGAERIVVSARVNGAAAEPAGIGLFVVDTQAPGVALEREWRIDSRNAAAVRLNAVPVGADAVLGAPDAGADVLQATVTRATIGLSAEMLGSMTAALELTLDYLKTRKQFGVSIGSFQALKHRAATMYIETELARSAVLAAHKAADEGSADLPRLASLAKARCSDAFVLIANEMIQMHGGIGMTDEHDAGFFLKRARVAAVTFGDAAHHRNRYAELQGY
jgi:alkylation response protein AidB-like acyl-CoA dehydrogenase